jgi:hypothetical protein
MLKEIKDKSLELLTTTSFHGIPNIIRTKRSRIKVIWTLFVILSFGLCSFLMIESVMDYLKFDVITKIRDVRDFPTIFPKVVVCNSNPFTTYYSVEFIQNLLKKYSIEDTFDSPVLEALYPSNVSNSNSFFNKLDLSKYLLQSYAMSQRINATERKMLGYKIEEVLISCRFNGNDCSASDFEWVYDFYKGNCFEFNSGRNRNGLPVGKKLTTKSGRYDGLQLELFVGIPSHMDLFAFNSGAILLIKNHSYNQIEESGVYVGTGLETDIVVERVFSTHIKKPYSECDLEEINESSYDSFLFQEMLRNNISYSQVECFDFCYQNLTENQCNCSDAAIPTLHGVEKCLTIDQVYCLYGVYEEFVKKDNRDVCDCPLECNSFGFGLTTSAVDYPSIYYGNLLSKTDFIKSKFKSENISIEDLRKSILKVNVYYSDLKFKTLSEFPSISLPSLLSDIGGKFITQHP